MPDWKRPPKERINMPSVRETAILPYTSGQPTCSVVTITPPDERHMHTYYDVCPWSPSGRYFACLRLPMEDRLPVPDEEADLCVIDLKERTIRTVWRTSAWGFQTAAHQRWGRTDKYLYFNDKRDGRPVGVRLDIETGEATYFEGTIWQIAPDETCAISPCFIRCNLTQKGYSLSVAPEEQLTNAEQASPNDGLYRIPVWDQQHRRICFQAAPEDKRQIFVVGPSLPTGEIPEF